MNIGEKVKVHSSIISDSLFWQKSEKSSHKGEMPSRIYMGTVVYIHPEQRYFTVRYDFNKGSFYESFKIV